MPVKDFDAILEKLTPLWHEKILSAYKRPGRNFKLELADILMMLLIYYRTYTTQIYSLNLKIPKLFVFQLRQCQALAKNSTRYLEVH